MTNQVKSFWNFAFSLIQQLIIIIIISDRWNECVRSKSKSSLLLDFVSKSPSMSLEAKSLIFSQEILCPSLQNEMKWTNAQK